MGLPESDHAACKAQNFRVLLQIAYQRLGYDVITVPSRAHRIPQTTRLVLREIPAFWVYYLRDVPALTAAPVPRTAASRQVWPGPRRAPGPRHSGFSSLP